MKYIKQDNRVCAYYVTDRLLDILEHEDTDKNNKVWDKESYYKLDKKEKTKHDFGQCGSCRACWNHKVKQVSYKEH